MSRFKSPTRIKFSFYCYIQIFKKLANRWYFSLWILKIPFTLSQLFDKVDIVL